MTVIRRFVNCAQTQTSSSKATCTKSPRISSPPCRGNSDDQIEARGLPLGQTAQTDFPPHCFPLRTIPPSSRIATRARREPSTVNTGSPPEGNAIQYSDISHTGRSTCRPRPTSDLGAQRRARIEVSSPATRTSPSLQSPDHNHLDRPTARRTISPLAPSPDCRRAAPNADPMCRSTARTDHDPYAKAAVLRCDR
jgi:hypothetical protein